MQSNIKGRDLDYLLLNNKKFLGCYIVQFQCETNCEKIYDIGQITAITGNDTVFMLKVDDTVWLSYLWDVVILPEVTEDDSNVFIFDKVMGIKFIILKKDKPK